MTCREVYSSDNAGNRVPPHPNMVNPVVASGLTVTLTNADTNYTLTVVGGVTYRIISHKTAAASHDIIFASITGVATTTANKEWAFPLGSIGIIKIPEGVTTLNLVSTLAAVEIYMAKLDHNPDGG